MYYLIVYVVQGTRGNWKQMCADLSDMYHVHVRG
jgi:hypothetical protein